MICINEIIVMKIILMCVLIMVIILMCNNVIILCIVCIIVYDNDNVCDNVW